MEIHWHRRDLRTTDNVALATAASRGPVAGLFVFDPNLLEYATAPRVRFLLSSLSELRKRYRDDGGDLLVASGDPATVVPRVASERGADRVVWNHDYSGVARRRDRTVEEALEEVSIPVETHHDAVLAEPGSITTGEGTTYSVYSYFWKKWRDREKPDPRPAPDAGSIASVADAEADSATARDPLPSLDDLGFDEPEADVQPGGTIAARERLEGFCEGPIYDYEEDRDYPARACTSRLSPHLSFGTIGIRAVYDAVDRAMAAAPDESARGSCEEFASQLAWREFYAHVLADTPSVVTENFKTYANPIEWAEDPGGLQAWKDGETGFPIVDAGMRQLRAEAYMHNRVRMIVASFLTKDLLIDWREGYAWFREKLADHDTANDAGGWQWAASTGTDAQPYFRIFNPMTQGERYDPEATYIQEYVPVLRDVPADVIHSWDDLSEADRDRRAPGYPAPIVDHAERRERALATFEAARGEE